MLIDEIIGQLMTENKGAREFLNELTVGSRDGRTHASWHMLMICTWNDSELATESDPHLLVLDGLREAVIGHHSKILKLARALGVPEAKLSLCDEDEYIIKLTREELSCLQDGDMRVAASVTNQILGHAEERDGA